MKLQGVVVVAVMAIGVTSCKTTNETVGAVVGGIGGAAASYGITKALWNETTAKLLRHHAKGKDVTLESALDARGIPLHPGAERFYKEAGLIK